MGLAQLLWRRWSCHHVTYGTLVTWLQVVIHDFDPSQSGEWWQLSKLDVDESSDKSEWVDLELDFICLSKKCHFYCREKMFLCSYRWTQETDHMKTLFDIPRYRYSIIKSLYCPKIWIWEGQKNYFFPQIKTKLIHDIWTKIISVHVCSVLH